MPRPVREIPWLETREGVYNVCWYEPPITEAKHRSPQAKGRTKRLGLRTRDANEAQARYAAFLATGYHKATANGQLTVRAALEQYVKEHVETKVVAKYRAGLAAQYLTGFFGDTPLPAIGVPECRAYLKSRGDASASTVRRELVVLRAAAFHALRWKRVSLDKMPTFELPSEADDGQEAPWFTKEEFEALLSKADDRLRDFIVMAYWWGARRGSVEALEARQVDTRNGRVNLQKAGEQVTNKRRPIVPVFPAQRETLERLLGTTQDGWLLGRGYRSYRPFQALCEACGFEEGRRNPHMLRHSRATHMLMDGESIYKVGKLLGDSVKTIEKVYGHYSAEFLLGVEPSAALQPKLVVPSVVQQPVALPVIPKVPSPMSLLIPRGRRNFNRTDVARRANTWSASEQDRERLAAKVAAAPSRHFRGVGSGAPSDEALDSIDEFLAS